MSNEKQKSKQGLKLKISFSNFGWLLVLIPNVRNSWVELTLENKLTREGCLGAYIHIFKLALKQCGIVGS